jgi:hypothetical protein
LLELTGQGGTLSSAAGTQFFQSSQTGFHPLTFRYKDHRIKGPGRYKTMTLAPAEFIRRFMLHVLPKGFHRIRHYGLPLFEAR